MNFIKKSRSAHEMDTAIENNNNNNNNNNKSITNFKISRDRVESEFEYSLHLCPRKHRNELRQQFPKLSLEEIEKMIIVPTQQKTKVDIIKNGEEVDEEKDYCLERFLDFARIASDYLIKRGFWADYIDPCSGLTMIDRESQQVYGEVDALVTLLNYECTNVGCCKIVLHPRWGSSVYPASIFASAPEEIVREALTFASREMQD
jgi:hypothetical protein